MMVAVIICHKLKTENRESTSLFARDTLQSQILVRGLVRHIWLQHFSSEAQSKLASNCYSFFICTME